MRTETRYGSLGLVRPFSTEPRARYISSNGRARYAAGIINYENGARARARSLYLHRSIEIFVFVSGRAALHSAASSIPITKPAGPWRVVGERRRGGGREGHYIRGRAADSSRKIIPYGRETKTRTSAEKANRAPIQKGFRFFLA